MTRMYTCKMLLYLHLHTHASIHSQEDLVWKIVWVSSAKDENLDQVLDEVDVPPDVGINKALHNFKRVCVGVRGCVFMFFRVCVLCGVLSVSKPYYPPLFFPLSLLFFSPILLLCHLLSLSPVVKYLCTTVDFRCSPHVHTPLICGMTYLYFWQGSFNPYLMWAV